jgi:hypothetical protein
VTRLQRDRDAAVREDGEQRHERITGREGGTCCSRGQSGGAGNQRFRSAHGTRGNGETGNQGTLSHGDSREHGGTGNQRAGGEICRLEERDGEPLTSAAKRRRQAEADAEEQQAAAGERPSSPVREDEEELPLLVGDPAGQPVAAPAITGHEGAVHENSESIKRFEEMLREEARGMLTGYLRDGTEYLSASTVRRVVQVASMSVVGSAIAVSRLDKEVRRVTATYPDEDPVTLADHMVRMCEEEVLDWMRTRTVQPGPDADPDPAGSPTGQELVKDLEKILAKEEADKYPPPGSKEDAWMMKVLEQATRVHCLPRKSAMRPRRETGSCAPTRYIGGRWIKKWDIFTPSLEAPRRTRLG